MDELVLNCENVFNELQRFSDKIISLGMPINDDRLEIFEKVIGYELPFDFKYLLKKCNGFSLSGVEVFGIGDEFKEASLSKVYEFEHYKVDNKMPLNFLPFSPDGRGNHYCLDLNLLRDNVCPVRFWQWDFQYKSFEDVEKCNDDFLSWINEVMIEWTLENFDYDGSEK
jgi:hypothetical protein